jgi:hypothetical protein
MFDELDDPAGAPRGDLARVLARAGARRRQRRVMAGVGSGAALSLVAGIAVLVTAGTPGVDSISELDPSPSVTASAASPTAEPSGSATPVPADPSATAAPSGGPSASPSPADYLTGWDEPDGKPGWSTGFTWCWPASTEPSRPPAGDLRLTVALDQDAYPPGYRVSGTATIHNDGSKTVHVDASGAGGFDGVLYGAGGQPVDGIFGNDGVESMSADVAAGGTYTYRFYAATETCGDTSADDKEVPAGDYTVAAVLDWEHSDGSPGGTWVGARVPVSIDPAAPTPGPVPPTASPLPRTAACQAVRLAGSDYGAGRGLTLSVAADSATVRSGDPLTATATVTNTGDSTATLDLADGIDGGVLLDGSGRAASGRREQSSGTSALTLAPGAKRTVAITVQTRTCAGSDLGSGVAPGRYDVQTGLYVSGFGWWPASGTLSVVVSP